MPADIQLRRKGFSLVADDRDALDFIQKCKEGQGVIVEAKRPRNYDFLKKYFALIKTAFRLWDCPNTRGGAKSYKAFRGEIIVLAGFRETVVKLDGTLKFIPESISFASMTEDDFADLYSKSVDVILSHVLTNYSRSDLDAAISEVMSFA